MSDKMKYTNVASFYDKARALSEENIFLWLDLISRYAQVREGGQVLDLGCGTGRFTLPMAIRLKLEMTGADISLPMLQQARQKDSAGLVKWDSLDAEELSYPDESFDLVFISHLLHHVGSPLDVLRNCFRILKPDGTVILRYGAIEQIRDDVEHRFFSEVLEIDEKRTPTVAQIESWLDNAGFVDLKSEEIVQKTYLSAAARLESVKLKGTSVLNLISDKSFLDGIKQLARYIYQNRDDSWLLHDKLTVSVGYKKLLQV